MTKRISIVVVMLLILSLFSTSVVLAQGFELPLNTNTRAEKVEIFINAIKSGVTTAFRLVTFDVLSNELYPGVNIIETSSLTKDQLGKIDTSKKLSEIALQVSAAYSNDKTIRRANVIDTVCALAAINEVSFVEWLVDGDMSDTSETRKKVITATLQGLYNLDPRVRLVAINWLRRLRPDVMMFRDVERAVEYETVASSYEKYRPKNIDIPSIDEPGAPGVNLAFVRNEDGVSYPDYYYNVPEETINYPFDEYNPTDNTMTKPDQKVDVKNESGYIEPLTGEVPTATQLDARKWGNGNPFDPDLRKTEIDTYIDVMTQAGALRRFRNTVDGYLLGYQYRLGAYYRNDYNGRLASSLTEQERKEIELSMVPIGHGNKYYYKNTYNKKVIGNPWAELIKLREFIVRKIWLDKILNLELNSLVIISKDSFKTLYLSIDGESAAQIPFLSTGVQQTVGLTDESVTISNFNTTPSNKKDKQGQSDEDDYIFSKDDDVTLFYTDTADTKNESKVRILDQRHIPVLIQGLLKNPVYSTKWVIARTLKDIYLMKDTDKENKKRINWALRQAKYDALAKDVISGAILHEELITVGKINVSQPEYPIVSLDDNGRYPETNFSGTYAGGVYIPRKKYAEDVRKVTTTTMKGFAIPNDEIVARRNAKLVVGDASFDGNNITTSFDWWQWKKGSSAPLMIDELNLIDRVLDSFSFYRFGIIDNDTDLYDGEGDPVLASSFPVRVEGNYGDTDYTAPVLTYYNNRDKYIETKSAYYRWYWYIDKMKKDPANAGKTDAELIRPEDQQVRINPTKYSVVKPYFNVEHYNRVVSFINAVVNGNNEVMATVTWDVVESAELLVLYRLFLMMESERAGRTISNYDIAKEALFYRSADKRDKKIAFFDAFQAMVGATIKKDANGYKTDYYVIDRQEFHYDTICDANLLANITRRVDLFKESSGSAASYRISVKKDFSSSRRAAFVSASLPGLYNKDPRVRITAINWLSRLGHSEDMFDDVRIERGILRQEEYSSEEKFDDPYRTDRPDTSFDRVEFLDTNIYHREDYPDIENDNLVKALFNDTGKTKNKEVESMVYIISKDFESFIYKRLGIEELAERVNFYDMKPGYSSNKPDIDPEHDTTGGRTKPGFPDFVWSGSYPELEASVKDDILQIVAIANPLYLEDRYEYYFRSYGLYQFKSPSEELEKLYRLIKREMLVNRIKGGKEADIFVAMPRFDFSILSLKLDWEYVLRIPMLSFFGLDKEKTLDVFNGYYNSEKAFTMPKGTDLTIDETYTKYPIFKEGQISLISQGVDNPNFIVQKGTAEYLIRFYNFYLNLEDNTRRDIRDAMFFYKEADIAIEEVTLAFEAEQPEGRSVIKAGTRLGNDLNPGGVRQYKNLPVELRKDIRRTINREVQSFEREIANILGVRRKSAVGEGEYLGYFSDDDYVPVKPDDAGDVPGEENS